MPRYICSVGKSNVDDIPYQHDTAENGILSCVDTTSLVTSPPYEHYQALEGKSFLPPLLTQHQRNDSFSSNALSAIEVRLLSSPQIWHGKSLMRGMCDQDDATSCTMNTTRESRRCTGGTRFRNISCSTPSPPTKVQREITYWLQQIEQTVQYQKRIQESTCKRNSACHFNSQTADLQFNLGQAYMKISDYDSAIQHYTAAKNIWSRQHGPHHVTIGRALDATGLAIMRKAQPLHKSKSNSKMDIALMKTAQQILKRAFAIRFHNLGVWHVDTVETYNKLASVHLHLGELNEACQAYQQVLLVRRAIFGVGHPSVAISAHSLANVYYKLQMKLESMHWYQMALLIYEDDLQLSHQHPTVAKLLKDRARLDSLG
jgi:tetratricopeptide (TPR) repeat protein